MKKATSTRETAGKDGWSAVPNDSTSFVDRHIGPDQNEIKQMLTAVGYGSLDELIDATVPKCIRLDEPLKLERQKSEFEILEELRELATKNKVFRSFIGMGYYDTITPPVIQRTILENPGWYTQYTPYQPEISQGRLEALLNFQTMVADLTGLPLANASLLDEATAAAEAMAMCYSIAGGPDGTKHRFFIAQDCHPQTIAVVQTRAKSMGIELQIGDAENLNVDLHKCCGVLVQYPTTDGRIVDYSDLIDRAHKAGAKVVYATDLLALCLIKPPGEWGADIAIGSSQRFGVPMGFGGPHAAFLSTKDEYARKIPGRLIGVSKDAQGNIAYRMAIQTREQHIKRERATSNICTAQVLLAIMASMYAVYHGPKGLRTIAETVHGRTRRLADGLNRLGYEVGDDCYFDTLRVRVGAMSQSIIATTNDNGLNLRDYADGSVGISIDETVTDDDVQQLLKCFGASDPGTGVPGLLDNFRRVSKYLTHAVFNQYHSETELLRYVTKLQSRDLSLAHSMIPLGSCTMKLNAAAEMLPITWPKFGRLHPFAPADQWLGYAELFTKLEECLAAITGFTAVSLQPNSGAQGEYAGLLAIRAYLESKGEIQRDICLIPASAHGTNPASAVIAGLKVVGVKCDDKGNVDVADLKNKCKENSDRLAALMITYPSTHGVFEEEIKAICTAVHDHGGQVYLDGANLNAMMGLCRPVDFGADVCHINLHKTFCIPHGGGGPGMGPIAVAKHLVPFLPDHPVIEPDTVGKKTIGTVSAAPYGSPSILPISYAFIAMMGAFGLKRAGEVAILNANYMAQRLEPHYKILYRGKNGRVAHEFIIDCRPFDKSVGIKVEDIAKRLMDYGFHAPTMSFPVPGTLMIEPTESETTAELDRYCDALISIRDEIRAIENGSADRNDNALKNAPHTIAAVSADEWPHKYSRQQAAYPAPWLRDHKFWPPVGRIDNPYGDRNLFCTCPPMSDGITGTYPNQ